MRKLICELTKGIGLSSSAASSGSDNYAKETVTKITMPPHRYSILPRIPGQCLARFKYHNARLVHDRFNYMTREARRPSFFIETHYDESFLNVLSLSTNNAHFFARNNNRTRAFVSCSRALDRPTWKGNKCELIKCLNRIRYIFPGSSLSPLSPVSLLLSLFLRRSPLPLSRHSSSIVRERREKDSIKS